MVELLMDAGCSKEAEDVHGRKPADAAESAGQAKIAEIIRGYRDPVLKVGGSVGISKRMGFLETGQLKLDGVGADRGGGGSLRASAKKLRKDLFAKLKGKKKYKAGMTKPKKPPVLPEIRFPSDAETYKPWVRYVSEAGEPYWSCSSVLCVVFPAARCRRDHASSRHRRDAYSPIDGTAGTTPRRTRRRGTSRLNTFRRPRARRASRRPRSGRGPRRRKPSARRTGAGSPRRRSSATSRWTAGSGC